MRKITKLSLVAMLGLSTSLSANTLEEAFANSKVKGQLKAAYIDSNFLGSNESDSVIATGGSLGVKTGSFYGLKAGVTFQASSVLDDGIDYVDQSPIPPFNVNGANVMSNAFNASGAVLSEAYLEYSIGNTTLKAGRQFINTPLISSAIDGKSSEAVVKDSFEAYVLTNTDIPNTTIVAGYVDKYQGQADGNGDTDDFNNFVDGAYTVYAKNNSVENLTLQAQYLDVKGTVATEDKDALYLQADYKLAAHTISGQYLSSTDKSQAANAQDGKAFGLQSTGPLGLGKLGYLVAYNSSTDKNAGVYTGAGAGTTDTLFTAMPVHGGGVPARADTDTLIGALVAPIAGATVIGYGGKSARKVALGDVTAMGAMVIYPVSKNMLIKANFEHVEVENIITEDTDTTVVRLSYNF